jgi:protein-S-isoprenylcysteine O-methyltransferase Ste14
LSLLCFFIWGLVLFCSDFASISFHFISFFNFRIDQTTVNPISPEKSTNLVINSFYRFTRNPMYLGMLLVLTGTAMLFGDLSGILLLPLFIFTMNELQIKPKEIALEKIFSDQYVNYKKKVRRWL